MSAFFTLYFLFFCGSRINRGVADVLGLAETDDRAYDESEEEEHYAPCGGLAEGLGDTNIELDAEYYVNYCGCQAD